MAELIRHERGWVTAIDNWVRAQPTQESLTELKQVLEARRSVLYLVERQLRIHDEVTAPTT